MSEKEKVPVFPKNKPGRRIKSLSPYMRITPYVMRDRGDASNYFRDTIEVSEIDKYLRQKRADGYKNLGMLHLFIAAYVRTVSQKPQMNRYITGQRAYARRDIQVVMTVKKTMEESGGETSIKVVFDPRDTVNDVYNKMNAAIEQVKGGDETATGDLAGILIKIPRLVLKTLVGFLCFLDYFNLMPKLVLTASPFHGSLVITDIGSLGIPPIYHHLYNFGNIPLFISFGARRRAYEVDRTGKVLEKKYVDYTIVTDERICDGYNYAQGLKMLKFNVTHPEKLEVPPETVVQDIY